MPNSSPIWQAFCAALGAEYREHHEIQGASGITHQLQAIAVDDKSSRVILISPDPNPRSAALMRVDVQATMPKSRVLVARPVSIDFAFAIRTLFDTDSGDFSFEKFGLAAAVFQRDSPAKNEELADLLGPGLKPIVMSMKETGVPLKHHFMSIIEQASNLDWPQIFKSQNNQALPTILSALNKLREIDNLRADREHGICPIPTYEFTEADWELLHIGNRVDDVRHRLQALDIYQYFYPPADNVALGLIDKGIGSVGGLQAALAMAEAEGHIIADNTLVPDAQTLPDIVDAMHERGFVVNAETEMELGPEGTKFRQKMQYRPPEGLLERISKIVSVKVDLSLKDLIK